MTETGRVVTLGDADRREHPVGCWQYLLSDVGNGYTDKSYVKIDQAVHLIL